MFAAVRSRLGGPAREAGRIARRRRSRRPGRRGRSCPRGAGTRQPGRERAAPRERSDPPLGPREGRRGRASCERRRSGLPAGVPSACLRALQARRPRAGRRAEPGLALRSSMRSPRLTAGRPRRETRPMAARTSGLSWVGPVDRLVCAQPGDESIFASASSSESTTGNARSSSNSDRVRRSGCSRVT